VVGDDEAASSTSVDDALTRQLGLPAVSTVQNGAPPEPTFQGGDVILTTPTATYTLDSSTGTGNLSISFQSMPANSDFDVNVRFGTSTTKFINIPISKSITSAQIKTSFLLDLLVATLLHDFGD